MGNCVAIFAYPDSVDSNAGSSQPTFHPHYHSTTSTMVTLLHRYARLDSSSFLDQLANHGFCHFHCALRAWHNQTLPGLAFWIVHIWILKSVLSLSSIACIYYSSHIIVDINLQAYPWQLMTCYHSTVLDWTKHNRTVIGCSYSTGYYWL